MHRAEPFETRFHVLGKIVVGDLQVAKAGLTTAFGDCKGLQHGGFRRDREIGIVGVPLLALDDAFLVAEFIALGR